MDFSHYNYCNYLFDGLPTNLDPKNCWLMPKNRLSSNLNRPRVTALTYRSAYTNTTESIMLSRVVYSFFWGDVGSVTVKRLCKNHRCWNPFHLKSVFNVKKFTYTIDPFVTKTDLQKLKDFNNSIKHKQNTYSMTLTPKDLN